jgi:hypothetical protein
VGELAWEAPQHIRSVHVTFAGHLLRDCDRTPPLWSDRQTTRGYTVQARVGQYWHDVVTVHSNGFPRRVHELPEPVTASALRLVVQATNGDPSAAEYEIRCC